LPRSVVNSVPDYTAGILEFRVGPGSCPIMHHGYILSTFLLWQDDELVWARRDWRWVSRDWGTIEAVDKWRPIARSVQRHNRCEVIECLQWKGEFIRDRAAVVCQDIWRIMLQSASLMSLKLKKQLTRRRVPEDCNINRHRIIELVWLRHNWKENKLGNVSRSSVDSFPRLVM